MCQPFSSKAVATAPRSPSGVAPDRGAGAVLPARCSCAGRQPNSRATVRWAPAQIRLPGAYELQYV